LTALLSGLAAGVLSGIVATSPAAAEPLRVGFYQNPPRLFLDDAGQPRGFWPEVIDALTDELDLDYRFVTCTWSRCLAMLERGELDVMPDVALTPRRAERFRFATQPAFYSWSTILVPETSEARTLDDLAQARIAVLAGGVQEAALRDLIEAGRLAATLVPVTSFEAALDRVDAGTADATIANRHFAELAVDARPLRPLSIPFGVVSLHLAFAPTVPDELIGAFDRALYLQQIRQGSAFDRALAHWIPVHAPAWPAWLVPGLVAMAATTLLAVALILLLRRLVDRRTRELAATVASLRAAMAARDEAEVAARRAQRMEAVGRLTSGIAHDFNNLLTVVAGNLDLLRPRLATDPEAAPLLAAAEDAAARGGTLTRQLLAFGRRAPLQPEAVPVNELVEEVMAMLGRTLPRRITLQIALDTAAGAAVVDRAALANALLNLVLNARDAMPEGGTITLATARTGPHVRLEVRDTGHGMDARTLERATEPFFTTKPLGEGSGMGLAMVQGFAAQSGGALALDSRPGAGTTVRLDLPAFAEDVEGSEKQEKKEGAFGPLAPG
jgi:signal transduction histidine kinase